MQESKDKENSHSNSGLMTKMLAGFIWNGNMKQKLILLYPGHACLLGSIFHSPKI